MTLRLRRKLRTTVRVHQLANQLSRPALSAGRLLVYSAITVGLLSSSTFAQQPTAKTYNPPVHISPNQATAVQKYSGIVEDTPRQSDYSIVGSIPEPTRWQQNSSNQQQTRRSPQLQDRIANAFGGLTRRGGPRQKPDTTNRNQPRTPTFASNQRTPNPAQYLPQSNKTIGTGLNRQATGTVYQTPTAGIPRPLPNAPRYQSDNETLLETPQEAMGFPTPELHQTAQYQQPQPFRASHHALAPEQAVQRRQMPRRYPVQPIEQSGTPAHHLQSAQRIGTEKPYYDRPDILATSAEQIDDDRFIEDQPEIRIAQTPIDLPGIQEPQTQASPISVLNTTPSDSPRISPEYYQEPGEFRGEPIQDVQGNDLRGADDAEDITAAATDDTIKQNLFEKSCDEFRNELLNSSITDIALDVSPIKSANASEFGATNRTWTDQFGRTIATGSISSVRRGYVIIESDEGLRKIPFGNLSDPDLEAVSQFWQTPKECTVSQDMFAGRSWVPQTLTWKASNLCHKPLFFENVQLERYGHSHGPFSQPVHSTVHFFTSLALLPYNSGINPPNECRYALGYYRPGNCAPWLVEPFPISLAGAQHQARAMLGGAFLITP